MNIDLVNNSFNPNADLPLSRIFIDEINYANAVDIAVGYVNDKSLEYLHEQVEKLPGLKLRLVCGMHAREGMTELQYIRAQALDKILTRDERGGVYLVPRAKYHGKLYLFDYGSHESAYVGSSNLSGIIPGYSQTYELGLFMPRAVSSLREHWEHVISPLIKPLSELDVPVVADKRSPMWDVDDAEPVSTSFVARVMQSPVKYVLEIPLKTASKSSLNAHMGGEGMRKSKSGGLNRSWYEGELIVNEKDRGEGYPNGEVFNVITDDGWAFKCKTSGQYWKNLRSAGKLSTLGTWMKSRLIEAGAIEFGDLVTEETLRRFGRDTLTMRYHPDFDVWTFDLSRF